MIKGKKIIIFGLGAEGLSAANFLGANNKIWIVDQKSRRQLKESIEKINVPFNFTKEENLPKNTAFNLVVRSPGIRPDHPQILSQIKKGAMLTSVTKIFFDECPGQIIGITGTKGKGTTATLIYEMIRKQTKDVFLAGNIGISSLEILPRLSQKSKVVLELSSFQLFDLSKSPHIAVVLMITHEHLDWHRHEEEYLAAKESIVKFQTKKDFAIINQDFNNSRILAGKTMAKILLFSTKGKTNGVYIKKNKIISEISGKEEICSTKDVMLPGKHNLQNIAAAVAVAKVLNIENATIQNVIKKFKGLKHRLQFVRQLRGIKFYNDSFSTTPETTIAAIEAFTGPKILILGGSSKNSDFGKLGQKISRDKSVKIIIAIGLEGPRILQAVSKTGGFKGKIIKECKSMKDIVKTAYKIAGRNDVVVLSPACASFDMFKNYKDRGEQFIHEVKKLK